MKRCAKVLVVDDDPVVGKSFDRVLSGRGYAVVTASDGDEALRKIAAEEYDVVFTDIRMPGMDGIAVAEQIRERQPWLPVVIVSGYATAENEARARAAGVSAVLHKPLSPQMIEDSARERLLERDAAPMPGVAQRDVRRCAGARACEPRAGTGVDHERVEAARARRRGAGAGSRLRAGAAVRRTDGAARASVLVRRTRARPAAGRGEDLAQERRALPRRPAGRARLRDRTAVRRAGHARLDGRQGRAEPQRRRLAVPGRPTPMALRRRPAQPLPARPARRAASVHTLPGATPRRTIEIAQRTKTRVRACVPCGTLLDRRRTAGRRPAVLADPVATRPAPTAGAGRVRRRQALHRLPRDRGTRHETRERRHAVAGRRRGRLCRFGARADRLHRLPPAGRAARPPGWRADLRRRPPVRAGTRNQSCRACHGRVFRPYEGSVHAIRLREGKRRGAGLRRLPSARTSVTPASVQEGPTNACVRLSRRHRVAQHEPVATQCGESSARRGLLGLSRTRRVAAGRPAAPCGRPAADRPGRIGAVRAAAPAPPTPITTGSTPNELRALLLARARSGRSRSRCAVTSSFGPAWKRTNCRPRRGDQGLRQVPRREAPCRSRTSRSRSLDADGTARPLRRPQGSPELARSPGMRCAASMRSAARGSSCSTSLLALGLVGGIAVPALHLAVRRLSRRAPNP